MRRVLVVDDEENIRLVLTTLLRKHGYAVEAADNGEAALARLESFAPDVVLTDVRMPKLGGLDLLDRLSANGQGATVIVMSAYGSVELAMDAMKRGAYDYLSKPFKPDDVLLALRKAEEREALRRENRALKAQVHGRPELGPPSKNAKMVAIYRTIDKVAEYKTTVLITGESGVGKELAARALHERGPRAKAPFVAINCGAIPENLLESELFGHRKGAFTDAHADRPGLFERADGGTLFLDEIGELPLPLQVKLLRVLQDESVRRLGDHRDIQVDVRIVAATHRDLAAEVRQGRFRDDLFYRINVLALAIPALRDRREDVPALLEHFIARQNQRLGTRVTGFSPDAMKRLLEYAWPGNVRELENTVERAMVLSESPCLGEQELPERMRHGGDPVRQWLEAGELSIKKTVAAIEAILIRRALERTRGNRTRAAELLEISHRALLYKLKDYDLRDL